MITQPVVSKPRFENHHNGFGVGTSRPRISWSFQTSETTERNWLQTAYDIEITDSSSGKPQVYHVESEESVLVSWPANPLNSRDSANVRVRVYGKSEDEGAEQDKSASEWSEPATVEVGLLKRDDWTAQFITSSQNPSKPEGTIQPLRFWKSFELGSSADRTGARLYITALGVFDVYLNGKPLSDEFMAPGWTSYKHRLTYRIIDVTNALVSGTNVVSAEVGEGWYAGRLGFAGGSRCIYGEDIGILAQLEVKYSDGQKWTLNSDDSWQCMKSAIISSEIYDGEVYDHRKELQDWPFDPLSNTNPEGAHSVKIVSWPSGELVVTNAPPVRPVEIRSPVKIFESESGKTILDFGQNFCGKLYLKSIVIPDGHELTFKHAEVMENGELGIRPLRQAKCTDTIIGSGKEIKNWTPHFTFHGFRYAQVDGWPSDSKLDLNDISAQVVHTDMQRRGTFECSNSSLNQLHSNIVWSMKSNFVSIPTDCPQRDERMGWTGDIQVFCPSASFLYDCTGTLESWLQDYAAEQLEEHRGGVPPLVVPDVLPSIFPDQGEAIWDDATILVPMTLYKYSGDRLLLERQFESMRLWLEKGLPRDEEGLWQEDVLWQLADWLDPLAPPENPAASRTDNFLVANAYLVHVTRVFAEICSILEKHDLAKKYAEQAVDLKAKFQHKYVTPAGNIMSNTQTALSLAIQFSLYANESQLKTMAKSLEKLVRMAKFTISTGFAGTPLITHALSTVGLHSIAYRMLLEKSCPSWMYPVTMGATTIWERWDSMLPDGSINPGEMTSFNHYALGAVAGWLHSVVGGLEPLEEGWKCVRVRPVPGGNLTFAKTRFVGPYGVVACEWTWEQETGEFEMRIEVPGNCRAWVTLPSEVKPASGKTDENQVEMREKKASRVQNETGRWVGSGIWTFKDTFVVENWPPKALSHPMMPVSEDIAT